MSSSEFRQPAPVAGYVAPLAAAVQSSPLDRGLPWLAALGLGAASGATLGWPIGGLAAGAVALGEWALRGRRQRAQAGLVAELGRLVELAVERTPAGETENSSRVSEAAGDAAAANSKDVGAAESEGASTATSAPRMEGELAPGSARRGTLSSLMAELAPELSGALRGVDRTVERMSDTDLTLEQRDQLETIQSANGTLVSLLGDLLDLARIDAGRLKLRRRDFQLAGLADTIAEELYPLAWKKGVELSIDVAPELNEWVWGDRRRIEQLLRHLVRGAIQSTDRGEVQLKLLPACPTDPSSGPVRFEIHDTAPVHTQAELARLLESSPGSLENLAELDLSLGLLLASGLVEVMGGTLGAHAKGSGGNLFWFEVPLEASEGPANEAEAAFNALVGVKLLVVDARQAARETLVAATERFGLIVHEAESRDHALELLAEAAAEQAPYDVALIDDDLQGGKGRALAEEIAATEDLPKPSMVLLTPSGRAQNPARLAELGIDAWIPKPVQVRRLQEALLYVCSLDEAAEVPQPCELEDAAAPRAGRVLVVEGERCGTRVLTQVLGRDGWRVEVLSDGAELCDAFQDGVFDAVVLDAACSVTAVGPGLHALREVLQSTACRTRIAVLMAAPDAGLAEAWCRAGADLCFVRPNSTEQLAARLGEALRDGVAPSIDNSEPSLLNMENPADQILDPDVIESLKELGGEDDPGLFAELVEMFLRDTPERISALQTALESSDIKEIERVAHSMKSSCGNLGALGLAELCLQIELAGRNGGSVDDVRPLVERSDSEYQRVRTALESELA